MYYRFAPSSQLVTFLQVITQGPGSLYEVPGYFACREINLTRIESRPSGKMVGGWLFFIGCEGYHSVPGLEYL